jgi:ribosomal protein S19E (S16A)
LAGSGGEVIRHVCKEVEELGFARNQAHNADKSPEGRSNKRKVPRVCNVEFIEM